MSKASFVVLLQFKGFLSSSFTKEVLYFIIIYILLFINIDNHSTA